MQENAEKLSIQVQSGSGGANLEAASKLLTSPIATFTPNIRYDGMSSVKVAAQLQRKEITPSA